MSKLSNVSPLRYPGGKTRACNLLTTIFEEHFKPDDFTSIVSPFFGGGSFEFNIQNTYNYNIVANDKFKPLYNFWNMCKIQNNALYDKLITDLNTITKDKFCELRCKIMDEEDCLNQAYMYFVINRCSSSGATLSGGFSLEASKKRFTKSSVEKIKALNLSSFTIANKDFKDFIKECNLEKSIMFLDPPYYLEEKSKLYGNKGDMHEDFDHKKLYECVANRKNWIMTYNNCAFIRDLYKDYEIIEASWSYGMNKTKKSSEIVIIG